MNLRDNRFLHPHRDIKEDFRAIYKSNKKILHGLKVTQQEINSVARSNTICIVGAALGDEGKGRIIDNMIGEFLKKRGITGVTIVRYQGGSNSGHTVQVGDTKLALHQVPSGVMYKKTTCIIDRGMTIHPEDLVEELRLIEKITGSIKGRVFLSEDAICNTDLDRAEELLNRRRQGKAGGGTGRGISPSYAHHYDRLGFHISDLVSYEWEEKFRSQYDRYKKEFALYGMHLADIEVPDFAKTKKTKKEYKRILGSRKIFLARLAHARREILARKLVTNTFPIHTALYKNKKQAVLFEGAQALGLHPWLGTFPDITSSDTSVYGVQPGTAFWRMHDIEKRIGIFKISYTSSVGARRMPTQSDEEWGTRVRDAAHEYGTTTGRPRDILYPDIPLLSYNCRMSGISALVGTHLDISWEDVPIPVCTHYTNKKGEVAPYQPGLRYLVDVIPHYIKLPGWNGGLVRKAKSFKALPENAKKFLAFLERRLGVPIVAVTTGPARDNYISIPS